MKNNAQNLIDSFLTFVVCVCASLIVFILIQARTLNTERAAVQQLKQDSHEWEQRWRDCQAALSMLRTPHPADAVNDVTR